MSDAVADASAILALLNSERGWQVVEGYLPRLAVSSVNSAEIVGKLAENSTPEAEIRQILAGLSLSVV